MDIHTARAMHQKFRLLLTGALALHLCFIRQLPSIFPPTGRMWIMDRLSPNVGVYTAAANPIPFLQIRSQLIPTLQKVLRRRLSNTLYKWA